MTTPPRKKLVPLSLCLWKKKEKVFLRPMMRGRPVRNSSCGKGGGVSTDTVVSLPVPDPGVQGPGPSRGQAWDRTCHPECGKIPEL